MLSSSGEKIDVEQLVECESDDNDDSNREQEIDADEDVIDEYVANTASEMDDHDDSDEESVSDGWAETTSDFGSSTRDLVPVSINAAL